MSSQLAVLTYALALAVFVATRGGVKCRARLSEWEAEDLGAPFLASLAAAIMVAFVASPGPFRWTAIAWLGIVGGFLVVMNWGTLVVVLIERRHISFVPYLGGLLVCGALAAVPVESLRWWAPAMLLLDPTVPLHIYGFCRRHPSP